MADGFNVDTSDFSRALRELSQRTRRSAPELLEETSRTILSNRQGTGLLEITPPAGGSSGTEARRAGEAAINRDLSAVFVGVKLKGERKEANPNVAAIHAERFARKRGKVMTRGRAQAYYVDRVKLAALRKTLYAAVGFLSSGWAAAAHRLGVRVPSWIARHGDRRGSVRITINGTQSEIEIANTVPDRAPVAEVERRLQAAVDYATARLDRNWGARVADDARAAGFRAS